MLSLFGLRRKSGAAISSTDFRHQCRWIAYDGRNRLSNFWNPTQRARDNSQDPEPDNSHDLLLRAGYLRQAHSGIFHLLPLGLRVQEKLERLIDKHMRSIGASKVSLSSLSSEELWQRSGRLDKGRSSELFRFADRKGTKYLLSPTHEEEITNIIANAVHTYKDLPLRLYQVSRKYRDEPRPRQGLLRGREFFMKDLYTFDKDPAQAQQTYAEVRNAYAGFLDDLNLPYLTARADSGNMGGTLSHEYHFASPQGEDTIIRCDRCDFSVNEELWCPEYDPEHHKSEEPTTPQDIATESYVSKDKKTLCTIYFPANAGGPNIYALKNIFPNLDPTLAGEEAIREHSAATSGRNADPKNIFDPRLTSHDLPREVHNAAPAQHNNHPILLTSPVPGSACPSCHKGKISLHKAVEIGHTFHLGTRYSLPFNAMINTTDNQTVPIEMGCHGIGVSRIIGAVAGLMRDDKGLNWPLRIAPFEVIVVASKSVEEKDVHSLYEALSRPAPQALEDSTAGDDEPQSSMVRTEEQRSKWDVVIDDRNKPLGWRLNDADLVGYPIIVVLRKDLNREGIFAEVQCRRLGIKEIFVVGDGKEVRSAERWQEVRCRLDDLRKELLAVGSGAAHEEDS